MTFLKKWKLLSGVNGYQLHLHKLLLWRKRRCRREKRHKLLLWRKGSIYSTALNLLYYLDRNREPERKGDSRKNDIGMDHKRKRCIQRVLRLRLKITIRQDNYHACNKKQSTMDAIIYLRDSFRLIILNFHLHTFCA